MSNTLFILFKMVLIVYLLCHRCFDYDGIDVIVIFMITTSRISQFNCRFARAFEQSVENGSQIFAFSKKLLIELELITRLSSLTCTLTHVFEL